MTQPLYWTSPDGTLHERYSAQLFVRDAYLGDLSYDSGRADLLWYRCSYAFFCPSCGEVWGRLVAADSAGRQQRFRCLEVACEAHEDFWAVPGSLLFNHLEALFADFPPAAILREFQIHLNYAVKEIEICQSQH